MKKEAINTFGEGLVMDLNPLTTPNTALTNALNSTLITYNGNEFVLQNDMGNGEVHTAYLDKGYVPVGMKEHGGIIYVAAHNPIIGKSQIGSFPSPQQLYEGEDLNVTPIQFDFSTFIDNGKGIPYIRLEHYKQKLFQTNNSDEVKIFHPGDRFVIVCNHIDPAIRKAIDDKVLILKLGVINSSGTIDFINSSDLKLYDNGLWIYENSNTPMVDVIRSKELVQVFSAKSSGALILSMELKTFDTFNLVRRYSDNNGVITVKFTGETKGTYTGSTLNNPSTIGLAHNNTSQVVSEITANSMGINPYTYSIIPVCPYGALPRMVKSGIIDFNDIRNNSQRFGEWRFYITDTYLKIGWGYDYYNLNEDSDIERIDFVFINLNDSAMANRGSSLTGDYTYSIAKEYYNGSFEEIIPFSDSTIQKNWVYIVRIDRYVQGIKQVIGYKTLYTGSYFNEYYASIQDFTIGLPSGNQRVPKQLKYKSQIESIPKFNEIKTYIKLADATEWTEKNPPSISDFVKEIGATEIPINYRYNTKKEGLYDVEVRLAAEYDYDKKIFAGRPDPKVISDFFGKTPSVEFGTLINNDIAFNNDDPITAEIRDIESTTTPFKLESSEDGAILLKGSVTTSRNIIATNGLSKQANSDIESLEPIFRSTMTPAEKQRLFSFKEEGNGVVYCVTGDEDNIHFNSRVTHDPHTDTPYIGENGGAGHDEDGLRTCLINMGNGTVGIFGGHCYDKASLRYENTIYGTAAWFRKDREVDDQDNFLIATWKDRQGTHHPINLVSRKTESSDINSNTELIRVEMMLKCFLSQMLVARRAVRRITYVGPDSSNFSYHTAFNTTCDINVKLDSETLNIDFFLQGNNTSIESHMSRWKSAIPEIVNFLPICTMDKPETISDNIQFGDNLRFDNDSNILNCYVNAYAYYVLPNSQLLSDENKRTIYICDPNTYESTNLDGSLNFTRVNGQYKTSSSFDTLLSWKKGSFISLGYNINDRFINRYNIESKSELIPEDYYNEVFIHNIYTVRGRWTRRGDGDAPDMAVTTGFGKKSIFNYSNY